MKPAKPEQKNEMKLAPSVPMPPAALDRFEPVRPAARSLADQLIQRGGMLIAVSRDRVLIRREGVVAEIDQQGRVAWRSAKSSESTEAGSSGR